MTPRPLPWMKPGDLILFDLEQLPWPAYLRMTESFFTVRGLAIQRLRDESNRVEYRVTDPATTQESLLHVIQSRQPVALEALMRLVRAMQGYEVHRGYLFTPGSISSDAYLRAGDDNVELYSGNKLRVRIESLREDLRRQVMDAISLGDR